MAQWVKNPPAMQETQQLWVRSIGQEDPPEEEMATHSSILAPKIPWTGESDRLQSKGSQRVGHDWATKQASKQIYLNILAVVHLLSCVQFFVTPWTTAHQCSLSFPEFAQSHVHWVGDAIQPSHALSPRLLLPSIFPRMRVFSNDSALPIR